MNRIAKIENLNSKSFEEYGEVIDYQGLEPCGTSGNHDYWDAVASFESEGAAVCSYLRTKKGLGDPVDEMERHSKTEEILVALEGDVALAVAKAYDGTDVPDESTIRCFHMKQGSGVVYKKGVWHALPCAVDKHGMLLVVFKRNTSYSGNGEETDIHFSKLENTLNPMF